jgi:hypothetical protein
MDCRSDKAKVPHCGRERRHFLLVQVFIIDCGEVRKFQGGDTSVKRTLPLEILILRLLGILVGGFHIRKVCFRIDTTDKSGLAEVSNVTDVKVRVQT